MIQKKDSHTHGQNSQNQKNHPPSYLWPSKLSTTLYIAKIYIKEKGAKGHRIPARVPKTALAGDLADSLQNMAWSFLVKKNSKNVLNKHWPESDHTQHQNLKFILIKENSKEN